MKGKELAGEIEEVINNLKARLGLEDISDQILFNAISHSSWASARRVPNNETLEFLGDAVFNLLITEDILKKYSAYDEGNLSKMRASLVNNEALAFFARKLQLDKFGLFLGKPSRRILANLFEAIIGAIYLDKGLDRVRKFFREKLSDVIHEYELEFYKVNWKGLLQEYTQREYKELPSYISERLSDGKFKVSIYLRGKKLAEVTGSTLKETERIAAREAIKLLSSNSPQEDMR